MNVVEGVHCHKGPLHWRVTGELRPETGSGIEPYRVSCGNNPGASDALSTTKITSGFGIRTSNHFRMTDV